ncbi:MAG: hypothetical protein O7C75_19370 [Verrucomicrobia bacterium]|nr:hypothetical protein [Verrucomicrobiota bacterium]
MSEEETAKSREKRAESNSTTSALSAVWAELKRRKVMRVAITYAVVGWVIMQIAGLTFEGFGIPVWAFRFVVLMVLLGFPIALIIAWAFELTPDGIKTAKVARVAESDTGESTSHSKKRNWLAYAVGAAVLVLGHPIN